MLKNNSTVKILSIVLAVCLWAFVIGEVNPTVKKTISEIPVELVNVETLADRDLALSSDEAYFTEIVVKGNRADLNKLKVEDIHATADVYGYEEGENNITIEVVVPNGIALDEVKVPEITVVLEDQKTVYLPVDVEFTGEAENKLEPSAISQMPTEVAVTGAASVVEKVAAVKVQLDVADLTEQRDVYSAVPTAWNKDGQLVKNVTISAQTVDVEAVLYHTKKVPLEIKVTGEPNNATVTVPEEITVRGTSEALGRITSISADSVDLSDVTKNSTVKISPDLPYGVELANSSKNIGIKIEF